MGSLERLREAAERLAGYSDTTPTKFRLTEVVIEVLGAWVGAGCPGYEEEPKKAEPITPAEAARGLAKNLFYSKDFKHDYGAEVNGVPYKITVRQDAAAPVSASQPIVLSQPATPASPDEPPIWRQVGTAGDYTLVADDRTGRMFRLHNIYGDQMVAVQEGQAPNVDAPAPSSRQSP